MVNRLKYYSLFYGGSMFNKDKEYLELIKNISKSYKNCQIKASLKVNSEMLKFYYVVGEGVSKLTKKNTYGAGLIKNVSKDLKEKLPSLRGLSVTNIGYMKRFDEVFSDSEITLNLGANLKVT